MTKDAIPCEEMASLTLFATTTCPAAKRLLTPALVPVPRHARRTAAFAGHEPEV